LRGAAAAGSAALEPAYSGLLPCGRRPDQARRIGQRRNCAAASQPVPLRLNRPTAVFRKAAQARSSAADRAAARLRGLAAAGSAALEPAYSGFSPCGRGPIKRAGSGSGAETKRGAMPRAWFTLGRVLVIF